GADVVIQNDPGLSPDAYDHVTAAAVAKISAVPGGRQPAVGWATNWSGAGGQVVTVLAVDPARYAALTATTPYPAFPAGPLGSATAPVTTAATVPVLASPAAAAILGRASARRL